MLFGVSAAISTMPPGVSSIECMIFSSSLGSSEAWNSLNVFMSSVPPNTEW